ncbi:hypothetical protein Acsp04_05860 [Actinomadura sp. NBRC 104425]|uniref:TIGR04222 domain-containing membrane protein n=1 Tax=Actinomadura sp. NBRC 104425 TaxID=3032204 RepID=UPI0024A452A1|nr:TIGR04222 domain-containing membrane protein [Actinomadura sp. NBRC 104425]GLZ10351.1 hypothetical protein Acsp04_05860 [Actinomadura sp. NBRC 104425]
MEMARLDRYELAHLCGGGERVAMVALVALCRDGRVRITSDRHRVHMVRAEANDALESAVLDAIPVVGRVLGRTMLLVSESDAVQEVVGRLRERRLVPSSRLGRLWQWRRVRAGKRIKDEAARGSAADELGRIAVSGASAIVDNELRKIFETHVWKPPRNVKPLDDGKSRGGPTRLFSTTRPRLASEVCGEPETDGLAPDCVLTALFSGPDGVVLVALICCRWERN